MTASRNSPGTAEISLNSILQKMSLLPSESQGSSHVLWDRCEFHLGTHLWRQFHCRSHPGKQQGLARNEISRVQETLPSETWERGTSDEKRF